MSVLTLELILVLVLFLFILFTRERSNKLKYIKKVSLFFFVFMACSALTLFYFAFFGFVAMLLSSVVLSTMVDLK